MKVLLLRKPALHTDLELVLIENQGKNQIELICKCKNTPVRLAILYVTQNYLALIYFLHHGYMEDE